VSIVRKRLFDPAAFDRELAAGAEPLPLFRAALRTGRAALRAAHERDGASGPDVVHGHAWLVDQLLERAWNLHRARHAPRLRGAMVAVGGYGRGELHPHSDVDLLILLARRPNGAAREMLSRLVSFLWDMGLEVGHSARTVAECREHARKDITVATNLMEARLLCGDEALFEKMLARTGPPKVWPSDRFFAAKLEEQRARHARFDDTAYNLEPNLKDGPGGLRDLQVIEWVARRHFGTASLQDLVNRAFLTEEEYRALIRGRNFLWRLRNGLHYLAGRREDRLFFDHQRVLAQQFGYRDRTGHLAVERLMKRYYRTVKELRLLNEILLQHFDEAILSRRAPPARPINRRFRARGDYLEVAGERVFEHWPWALLELFSLLQQHPELKGVRASTIRLVRANVHRINSAFRRDIVCRSLFMEIMRHPGGLTHALRRMNAYGVLGAYIPDFGRVVGQMQHDLFHVYTVDEHTLFVVRNLRRIMLAQDRGEMPEAITLVEKVVKIERLFLAALFHDVAKGRGGDHSELGEKIAFAFCKRHDMSDYDAHLVAWLVRHHLALSRTSQHEDTQDPEVLARFARLVGDQEHLDLLYLLTIADMRGTSPAVWNSWKGRLLAQLHGATTRVLRQGFGEPIQQAERVADLKREVADILAASGLPAEAVERHWSLLDDAYFLKHDARSIAWHCQSILATSTIDLPLVAARTSPEHEGIEFLIFAPDRDGLFADITGKFERLRLSIAEARMHTTRTGFALDVFVALPVDRNAPGERDIAHMCTAMRQHLLDPRAEAGPPERALPRTLRHFPLEPAVTVTNAPGAQATTLEVVAQDRPGLLYRVALALNECKVRLLTAKIATFGERAEDVFFVCDRDCQPLADEAQIECLRAALLKQLEAETGTQATVSPAA